MSATGSHLATGHLAIIGLGPGDASMRTAQASDALTVASDLVGYGPYLDRIAPRHGQARHGSDNRQEPDRARHALELAIRGRRVAIVSSGDAGVFAMASTVFETIERGAPEWRRVEVEVIPGVSAMFAAAARVGAPLGHDFCAISLSDNLKPFQLVLARVEAAARAGFVLALYNPRSLARPWQFAAVLDTLRLALPAATPLVFATALGTAAERTDIVALGEADPARADMRTLILVGSRETRRVERAGAAPWLYTPRSAA